MKDVDFNIRKIWVGNDSELRKKVVSKLAEYGITISPHACCRDEFSCIWISGPGATFGTYDQNYKKIDFDKNVTGVNSPHTELSVEELLEEVNYQIY